MRAKREVIIKRQVGAFDTVQAYTPVIPRKPYAPVRGASIRDLCNCTPEGGHKPDFTNLKVSSVGKVRNRNLYRHGQCGEVNTLKRFESLTGYNGGEGIKPLTNPVILIT